MKDEVPESPVHAHHHAVQFYGDEESLFSTVAGFLSEGLVAGQPAIIIATPAHQTAIVQHLSARLIDVEQARQIGDLVRLDAADLLASFMRDDKPDADAFERHVGGVIERVIGGRPRTVARAYGEMVDLLWQDRRVDAAMRVEMLWNKLARSHGFALLCGYSMGHFYKQAERFREVCEQHTHVLDSDKNVVVLEGKRATRGAR